MATKIQLRRDTAANWASENPILASGEMGIETDTSKFKIGDAATAWNSLQYASSTYTDSDVDAHLNSNTAANGQFLSWNGTDYAWDSVSASPWTDNTSYVTYVGDVVIGRDISPDNVNSNFKGITVAGPYGGGINFQNSLGNQLAGRIFGNLANLSIRPGIGGRIELEDPSGADVLRINNDKTVQFAGAFTFPNTDGTANQVLTTDGSGTVTWEDVSAGSSTPAGLFTIESSSANGTGIADNNVKSWIGCPAATTAIDRVWTLKHNTDDGKVYALVSYVGTYGAGAVLQKFGFGGTGDFFASVNNLTSCSPNGTYFPTLWISTDSFASVDDIPPIGYSSDGGLQYLGYEYGSTFDDTQNFVVAGNNASASIYDAVAIGRNSSAQGYTTVLGGYATATSTYGVALGHTATAGNSSLAAGRISKAPGAGSIALGYSAGHSSLGTRSICIGQSAGTSGAYTGAIHINASTGGSSTAISENDEILITTDNASIKYTSNNGFVFDENGTTYQLSSLGVQEKFSTLTSATGTVDHDCDNGHVFYHTTPSANWTANLTNLQLSEEYATTVMIVIDQGATAYIPTAIQIGGVAQTLLWQGGSQPSGTTNGTDILKINILNDGGTYVVMGELVGYS